MSIADLHDRLPGIADTPLIGIFRKIPTERVLDLVRMSTDAGLKVVEVTLDSPSALGQIARLTTEIHDTTVGAGSVNQPQQVFRAREEGARFIVSPIFSAPVARACNEVDLPYLPGAATPTEIQTALDGGALAVKVFPAAQLGGSSFIRAIRSPLGDPPLMPTGGITPSNAGKYLEAGAVCLGVGSSLFKPDSDEASDETTREEIEMWIETVS